MPDGVEQEPGESSESSLKEYWAVPNPSGIGWDLILYRDPEKKVVDTDHYFKTQADLQRYGEEQGFTVHWPEDIAA